MIKYSEYEEMLIAKTYKAITTWCYNNDNPALSFSGGKDSTVLLFIIRDILKKDIPIVFCNTGVEYNKIVEFTNSKKNIIVFKPKLSFLKIIEKYGYPVISKEQSRYLEDVKNPNVCDKVKQISQEQQEKKHLTNSSCLYNFHIIVAYNGLRD